MNHDLKTWPDPYEAVEAGLKTFEWRKDDRNYQVGDTLTLKKWNPRYKAYTGKQLARKVTHILRGPQFCVPEGFVCMSISQGFTTEQAKINNVLLLLGNGLLPSEAAKYLGITRAKLRILRNRAIRQAKKDIGFKKIVKEYKQSNNTTKDEAYNPRYDDLDSSCGE